MNSNKVFPLACVLLLSLYGIGGLFEGPNTWGFNFLSIFGPPLSTAIAGIAIFLILVGMFSSLFDGIGDFFESIGSRLQPTKRLSTAVAFVLTAIILYLLRSHSFIYGDGYAVLESAVGESFFGLFTAQHWLQPLSVALFFFVGHLAESVSFLSVESAVAGFICLGGATGLCALCRLSVQLGRTSRSRLFIWVSAVASGSLILFFGYIEYYTWSTALALWSLLYALRFLEGKNGPWPMISFAIIAALFHLISLPFLLAALVAILIKKLSPDAVLMRKAMVTINVSLIVLSFLIVGLWQLLKDYPVFVPLWPKEGYPYWFLSTHHLIDQVNLLFLLAPIGLLSLLVAYLSYRNERRPTTPTGLLLGSIVLYTLLVMFWVDPLMGAPRDWDLLSLAGFPLSIYGAYRWVEITGHERIRGGAIVAAIAVMLVAIAPNLYEKSDPLVSLERLEPILSEDIHYSTLYDDAYRTISLGFLLRRELGRNDLAEKYFRRRLSVEPNTATAWFNLGNIYTSRNSLDSAMKFFQKALDCKPDNATYMARLAEIEASTNHTDDALRHISTAVNLLADDARIQFTSGIIHARRGEAAQALQAFRRSHELDPKMKGNVMNIGLIHAFENRNDSAIAYLERALRIDPTRPIIYEPLINALLETGQREKARYQLDKYERMNVSSDRINSLRRKINASGR